jgi:hypothetical protein
MIKKRVLVASFCCCLSGISFGMQLLNEPRCRERDFGYCACNGTHDLLYVSSPDIAIVAKQKGFRFHEKYLEGFSDAEIEKRRAEIYGDPQLLERVLTLASHGWAALPFPREESSFYYKYDFYRACIHHQSAE